MQRVVFVESLSKKYVNIKNKVRRNRKTVDKLKLITTVMILLFTMWVYWYFINISSTKWYFLREEMRELENKKFEHSLVQLEVLQNKREIRQDIQQDSIFRQDNIGRQPQWLSVNDRIIYIETDKRLTNKN